MSISGTSDRMTRLLALVPYLTARPEGVAQRFLAAAIDTPVSFGDVAAECGAWGIAVLADFANGRSPGQTLADYYDTTVFTGSILRMNLKVPAYSHGYALVM